MCKLIKTKLLILTPAKCDLGFLMQEGTEHELNSILRIHVIHSPNPRLFVANQSFLFRVL